MRSARIFLPPKTAMQSGRAKTKNWTLEIQSDKPSLPDSLMGWSGGADSAKQVRLNFNSQQDAIAYAQKNNILYTIEQPQSRKIKPKSYAANFAPNRKFPWTH